VWCVLPAVKIRGKPGGSAEKTNGKENQMFLDD